MGKKGKNFIASRKEFGRFRDLVGFRGLELIIKEVLSISVFICALDFTESNRVSLFKAPSFLFYFRRLLSPRRLQVSGGMEAYVLQ